MAVIDIEFNNEKSADVESPFLIHVCLFVARLVISETKTENSNISLTNVAGELYLVILRPAIHELPTFALARGGVVTSVTPLNFALNVIPADGHWHVPAILKIACCPSALNEFAGRFKETRVRSVLAGGINP